jgi:hypothetical protein
MDNQKRELELLISQELEKVKQLRQYERGLKQREKAQLSMPQFDSRDKQLSSSLKKYLPTYLMPGNVGHLNQVTWPFWFNVTIDFGTNPDMDEKLEKRAFFKITEESGLLLTSISRHSVSYTEAGRTGPWSVIFRDRQSSRQFNDNPIPLQMLGTRGRPTVLPTPMLLMPNAILEVQMNTLLSEGERQIGDGNGEHIFTFFGYRIRIEDYQNVSSTVYGR